MTGTRRSLTVLVATLAVASLALLTAPSALAATFIVTRFDDPAPSGCAPSDCSLREAVIAANTAAGNDTIQLSAGRYTLSIAGTGEDSAANGDLDVTTDPLVIHGEGSAATIIDGGGAAVNEPAFQALADLSMSGLTVTNSSSPGTSFPNDGSGINVPSMSTLTLNDVVVTGNSASAPDGCCSGISAGNDTTLNLTNVEVSGNTSGTDPSQACCTGIIAGSPSTLNFTNVSITDNSAADCCPGLVTNAVMNFNNVVIANNTSFDSCCAGLTASVTAASQITNSAIVGNRVLGSSATGQNCCAGIVISGDPLTLRNVTVSGNQSQDCCAGIVHSLDLVLNNVTVTGNSSELDNVNDGGMTTTGGAGIFTQTGGTTTISNTLLFGNVASVGPSGDCSGPLTSAGYNLLGAVPAGCTFTPSTGDQIGVDPMLGPLGDNGGFVPTVPIKKGSPAVNGGNPAPPGSGGGACETTDARGLGRNCDIGAYELTFCQKVAVNRIGTTGNDSLRGTKGRDGMLGFGGKDTLRGKGGKDGLCGGPGKDLLKGGAGKDRLDGGPGKDTCVGGPGKDKARACEVTKTIP